MYFYGWACSCSSRTHKQTPRAVRRMKFIEFVHRRKIIYSVISPSRTIQIRSSSSTNVHCSRKLFKWLSISSGCSLAPSCSKVVLRLSPEWPEGACTFVQKTMIDLIARAACDDRGRVESNFIIVARYKDEHQGLPISHISVDAWWSIWICIHSR